ncbi:hypothetical protein DESC_590031 [Desulfosarcina cetonica]|nr:hypothetical protein DESC_590031 [Desulfosarcina cetonica]
MANLHDIHVPRKILSSKYQPYACGKIFRAPRSRPNFPISGWALVRIQEARMASNSHRAFSLQPIHLKLRRHTPCSNYLPRAAFWSARSCSAR